MVRSNDFPNSDLLDATVDAVCDQFEAAWLSQQNPRIEDYLSAASESISQRLVKELLLAEFDLCRRSGEPMDAADYLRRFPDHTRLIQNTFDRHIAEGALDTQVEAKTNAPGSNGRICVQCPQCNTSLELVVDASFTEIKCSNCRNCFSLVDDGADKESLVAGAIIGHFALLEKVGMGGFGSVWKARDQQLDRIVAIKIPRRGQLNALEIEQFLREARTAAQLRHPNIVGTHEIGRDGETVYIVSEFIDGETLSDYIADRRLSPRDTVLLCNRIAEALQHAHDNGIVHRDLKPSNIIIDSQGKPHLADFGLARRDAGDVTMTCDGHVLGTPAYMSPELAQGKAHDVDQRSDVYSLGVLLYRLLTGEPPFRGTVHMLVHQIVHEEPPSPRKLNNSVPRDLETICLKCLEKNPKHRYDSARDVAGEFERYLGGQPIVARPISKAARACKLCRRNPSSTLLVAALVGAILCGSLGVVFQWLKTRREAERNRELLYVSDIAKISEAWESGSAGVAWSLLERHVPHANGWDMRGFEWHLLWKRCQPSLKAETFDCDRAVFDVAISPDGRFLAAGGPGTVFVFDTRTGELLHRLEGHSYAVVGVAFSPAGLLASSGGGGDYRTCLWNVETGEQLARLESASATCDVDFSPRGDRLAVCEGRGVRVWDISNLHHVVLGSFIECPGATSVEYSQDGSRLACGCDDGTIRLWNADTADSLPPFEDRHAGRVNALAFSPDPDTNTLLSGSVDRTVLLWDVTTGTTLKRFEGHAGYVASATFSPDGMTVASASHDGTAILWDVASGELRDTIRGHEQMVYSAVFDPNGRGLFTGSTDGTIRRWDLADRDEPVTFERNSACIAIDSGGRLLAMVRDSDVIFWDLAHHNKVATFKGQGAGLTDIKFSPNGKMVAFATWDNGTTIWGVVTQRMIHRLDGRKTIAFSSDGKILATVGPKDPTIQLWDLVSGKPLEPLPGIGKRLNSLAFSPDGTVLASGGTALTSRNFVLWDVRTGKEIAAPEGHEGAVDSVAFSPDGEIVCTAGYDGRILLWNSRTWKRLENDIQGQHVSRINSVAFSSDGRTVASGSRDGTIKLWHVPTGGHLLTLKGHTDSVHSVIFSRNVEREMLVSASDDGTARLWPAATREELEQAGW